MRGRSFLGGIRSQRESPEEIQELVISCSLTDETLSKACDLIRQWITEGNGAAGLGPALGQSFSPDLTPADRPA